jgi:ATP citrate (pro-S)-lyase
MSTKPIREYEGKLLLKRFLEEQFGMHLKPVRLDLTAYGGERDGENAVKITAQLQTLVDHHAWLKTTPLVIKPDQLLKRRGKNNLLLLNATLEQATHWLHAKALTDLEVNGVKGRLDNFIVEPFVEHDPDTEHYVAIVSQRDGDELLYSPRGGVNVGDVDTHARRLLVPIDAAGPQSADLLPLVNGNEAVARLLASLYAVFVDLGFSYLEINPLVVLEDGSVHILDLAAKLDQTGEFECGARWREALGGVPLDFPAPFGRRQTPEEAYIASLDAKTGASLKLTLLNPRGRIWTMVAGGGASVAYADAIVALGHASDLANYGEYSGAPSETQTYEYAKTILKLMTQGGDDPRPDGKILFIGGGIANFTNVAATFAGIIRALREFQADLQRHGVEIFVRRGGPNYQEGLRLMRELGDTLGVPLHVFGPETHITAIVPLALGDGAKSNLTTPPEDNLANKGDDIDATVPFLRARELPRTPSPFFDALLQPDNRIKRFKGAVSPSTSHPLNPNSSNANATSYSPANNSDSREGLDTGEDALWQGTLFTPTTQALVFGMQPKAVQSMLDFDYVCKRPVPSVAAMIYPFGGGNSMQRCYWGAQETLVPVYTTISEAARRHPQASVLVNFASSRSVGQSVLEALDAAPHVRTVAIVAEGVPERQARLLAKRAKDRGVLLIGPATVGGLTAGAFKIGNTGGMIDNIIAAKLNRPGHAAYVSKSGGMSNELNSLLARHADGICEGVAIGGDRYPGSSFLEHVLRFEANPQCQLIILLGEVGGTDEYKVAEALCRGQLTKPIIAWCLGTCSELLGGGSGGVQFGHAGACAASQAETAAAKNAALRAAGAVVPDSFEALPHAVDAVFRRLQGEGKVGEVEEPDLPKMPIDYAWAQELGLIRKPASFVSTICDDRGQELLYAGMPISAVFRENIGIGGVVSLLWFKRRLPPYACAFIEMVLMLCADHGPAVSGAHNTIVAARAGKDLISSLCSGLLTIGERFGGATDGAAEQFAAAYDQGQGPADFVQSMRRQNKLILGIGHKIKSKTNPDLRVRILQDYARQHFPATTLLDYALQVETLTTAKKDNLILNVDGTIGVLFVDLLRSCGAFTRDEADEYVRIGTLNGLFVLGRSIGFIGHYIDQRQLKQGLYRHPWDDISYLRPDAIDLAKFLSHHPASNAEGGDS